MHVMKKIAIFLCIFMLLQIPVSAVTVELDGQNIEFEAEPLNDEGTVLIPLRAAFEAMDADVEWMGEERVIIITKSSSIIAMKIDSKVMIVNDISTQESKTVELKKSPKIVEGRTYVPLRAVSDALDYDVDWDGDKKHITISTIKNPLE